MPTRKWLAEKRSQVFKIRISSAQPRVCVCGFILFELKDQSAQGIRMAMKCLSGWRHWPRDQRHVLCMILRASPVRGSSSLV